MAKPLDLGSRDAKRAGSTPAPSTLFANARRSRKRIAVGGKRLGTHARMGICWHGERLRSRDTHLKRRPETGMFAAASW